MRTQFIKPENIKSGRRVKTVENCKALTCPREIFEKERKGIKEKAIKRPQCKATKRDSKQCTSQSCEGHQFCKRHIVVQKID